MQVSRRTWDTEEYQKRADERREEEERLEREKEEAENKKNRGAIVRRDPLNKERYVHLCAAILCITLLILHTHDAAIRGALLRPAPLPPLKQLQLHVSVRWLPR